MAIDSPGPAGPGPLATARAGLASRLTAAVGPDGLLHAPCAGRLLETALALHLLTVTDTAPALRERLTRWLRRGLARGGSDPAPRAGSAPRPDRTPGADPTLRADPVQLAAARAALGEPVDGAYAVAQLLVGFEQSASARTRLTLRILLAELGAGPFPALPGGSTAFDSDGRPDCQAREFAALRVLHAAGTGTARPLAEADRRALAAAAEPGPPPYANHLVRLLALLALRHHPEHLPAVRARAAELGRDLAPDGGLPFVTGLDVLATATGGVALAAAGTPTAALRPLARALARRQNEDGGWAFTRGGAASEVDSTAYAVEFLRAVTDRVRSEPLSVALAAGEQYLLGCRNQDGGFRAAGTGGGSEPAVTAGAVNALAGSPEHRPVVREAVGFLAERQLAARGFERCRSLGEGMAIFRSVLAYETLERFGPGGDPVAVTALAAQARAHALGRLLDTQRPDGGWGHAPGDPSDPISTGYALIALGRHPAGRGPARRALRHLLAHRRPDGSVPSRPDRADPGPLAHDVPLLADITALTALGHAARLFPADLPAPREHSPQPGHHALSYTI
ncbi:prenyltransferase/squalene oxidase repeat-containing protein [Streptomyces sp. TLI_171]|uniref:prenyltransferase/squalene oxidase repeat-containing protein n=1 Tax=Streptomyces sp. TLI_171 TaxID=1938859 RepID=UPI000C19212D|nr:prenyltransferase/squalene oxidase repeat-containing protein [Streptomyces sp. TLI_171]RKE18384.1 squalene-hopene/tetraprenyl-beta-curcumene cyclase/sporulenol synthase [Streptomyces sp. TLI_171]